MNTPTRQGASRGRFRLRAVSYLGVAVAAFVLGGYTGGRDSASPSRAALVTGIGGIFFTSEDPAALKEWYHRHLGIEAAPWGGHAFLWTEQERPEETGYTIWTPFPDTTSYLAPGRHEFMINYRVTDLAALIAALRSEGVTIVGDIERHPNGAFAWVLDPEGRKIELFQPVPSRNDPYLRQE